MLIKPSLVGPMSGKLGGLVAARNKGGTYLRRLTVVAGTAPSVRQGAVRGALAYLAAAWAGLTGTQRSAWEAYAANVPGTNALGDTIQLSGQNYFLGNNIPRLQADLAVVEDGPTVFNKGDVNVARAEPGTLTAGTVTFNLAGGDTLTAAASVLIYQGQITPFTRTSYYGHYRYVGKIDLTGGATGGGFVPQYPLADPADGWSDFKLVVSHTDGRLQSPMHRPFRIGS